MFSLLLLCISDIDEVGDIGKGEDEWWAGFRAVVRKEEPNPACKFGTPELENRKFVLFMVEFSRV